MGEHKISVSEAAKAQAIKSRDSFIDNLTEQIHVTARFPQESQDLVDAFSILSLRGVSFMTAEELSNYGNVQLLELLNHFGQERTNESGLIVPAVVNPTQAKVEWSLLKDVVKEQYHPTEKLGTFSNSDFCNGYGDQKSVLLPVEVLHFGWQPYSLRTDVRTARFTLSTKLEYIFFFHTVIIVHFSIISFPKASTKTRQHGIEI